MQITLQGKDFDLSDNRDYRRWVERINEVTETVAGQFEAFKRDYAMTQQMVEQAWNQAKTAQESANRLQEAANAAAKGGGFGGMGGGGLAALALTSAINPAAAPALPAAVATPSNGEGAWTYLDISSPALSAVAAPAATITAIQTTNGSALTPITQATGKDHLDWEIVSIQNTPGVTLPTDASIDVRVLANYNASSLTWTLTPQWRQIATAAAAAIAVQVAGVYRATVRYRQRTGTLPA